MVKLTAVKYLLPLTAKLHWTVFQLDVNNVFFHGDFHEDVYMKISPRLQVNGTSSCATPLVCKLRKSLYGLKQASRQWFFKLSEALLSRGYIASKHNYSLFTKSSVSSLIILVVYMDDILLAGSDFTEMNDLKSFFDQQFQIKDLGLVHYFLGLEIISHTSGFLIHQHKYASDLLHEFHCSHLTLWPPH